MSVERMRNRINIPIFWMRTPGVPASALVVLVILWSAKVTAFDEAMYQIRWSLKKNGTCVMKHFNNTLKLSPFFPAASESDEAKCVIFFVTKEGVFEHILLSAKNEPRKTGDCLGSMDEGAENGARIGLVPCRRLQTQIWRLTKEGYLQGINLKCIKQDLHSKLVLWACKQPLKSEQPSKSEKEILERLPTTKWYLKKITPY
jgi:hypothetical protein